MLQGGCGDHPLTSPTAGISFYASGHASSALLPAARSVQSTIGGQNLQYQAPSFRRMWRAKCSLMLVCRGTG